MKRTRRASKKGMTLIELMMVVVILSTLSVVAVNAYHRYIYHARTAEATQMLGAIRVAQENYFQAFGQYCGTTTASIWPTDLPFATKLEWGTPPSGNAFRDLGVQTPGQVWFQYSMAAGNGSADASMFLDTSKPWFWARAIGDFDHDARQSTFEITSQSDEIYSHNKNY